MLIYKILFHIAAAIKKVWLKLIYGNAVVFGKGVTWRSHFHLAIEPKAKVEIGENCFFNHDCSISAMQQVTIGANTLFGENVRIYDHNHRFRQAKNIADQGYTMGAVSIGKNCWICSKMVNINEKVIGNHLKVGNQYLTKL